MKTAEMCVKDLAKWWDMMDLPAQPITVNASRRYMQKWFKPAKRGGVLMCGSHEVRCIEVASRQLPEQMDIEDLLK